MQQKLYKGVQCLAEDDPKRTTNEEVLENKSNNGILYLIVYIDNLVLN